MRYYGRNRYAGDPLRCIATVSEPPHYIHSAQCTRRRGHGPDGAYCRQHAGMIARGRHVRVPSVNKSDNTSCTTESHSVVPSATGDGSVKNNLTNPAS